MVSDCEDLPESGERAVKPNEFRAPKTRGRSATVANGREANELSGILTAFLGVEAQTNKVRYVKGDVIIIPNGVPHWFKQVDAP